MAGDQFYSAGKGQLPILDFNCPRTFNPETDVLSLAERAWDFLTWPVGFESFQKHLDKRELLHCGFRGDHYAQKNTLDSLLSIEFIEEHLKQGPNDCVEVVQDLADDAVKLEVGSLKLDYFKAL